MIQPLSSGTVAKYVVAMLPRRLRVLLLYWSRQLRGFIVERVLHADDPPHRIALGFAIGVWVTFTPTIGFQMLLIVFLAWLLRANKVVGLPVVWITNPATVVPIYYPCYWMGCRLLGIEDIGLDWWRQLAHPPAGWWPMVRFYGEKTVEIFEPLWVGSLIVATILAIPAYLLVYLGVRWYRLRRWGTLVPPRRGQAL